MNEMLNREHTVSKIDDVIGKKPIKKRFQTELSRVGLGSTVESNK